MAKRLTQEEWDNKRTSTHGERYDCLDIYSGNTIKLRFRCQIENHPIFITTPKDHLYKRIGCHECNKKNKGGSRRKNVEWLKFLAEKHSGECLSNNYINNSTKYSWVCGKCRFEWMATANQIQVGYWCPKCGKSMRKNLAFLQEIAKKNNGKCLSKLYVNEKTKYRWQCSLGHQWIGSATSIAHAGTWCPTCKKSKGEKLIEKFLIANNIQFTTEHSFPDCKKIRTLKFDFFLPEYNLCIEYDGEQHFFDRENGFFKKRLVQIQLNDNIKTNYCRNNSINIMRIPYTHLKKIDFILSEEFCRGFDRTLNLSEQLLKENEQQVDQNKN